VFIAGSEPQRPCDRHGSGSDEPAHDLQTLEELDREILDQD